jgi:hypothetical protein
MVSSHVRVDADGRFRREMIEQSTPSDAGSHRDRQGSEDAEEVLGLMEELGNFIAEYLYPDPVELNSFLRSGFSTGGEGPTGELTKIAGGNFIMPRDSVQLWVDSKTFRWRKLEIRSTWKGNSVHLQTVFADLPGGPEYPLRTILFLSERGLELKTENDEPVRRAAPGAGEPEG